MDDIDLELSRELKRIQDDPEARARQERTTTQSTYTRPVRSWSLVLRANDKRMDTQCGSKLVGYKQWDPDQAECAVVAVQLTAESVRALCRSVHIPWPGVSIARAAKLFGVNPTTIRRWGRAKGQQQRPLNPQDQAGVSLRSEGRVVIDYHCRGNGRDLHRAVKRVWTRSPVSPAGDVQSGPWGTVISNLADRVPQRWSQSVLQTHRPLGRRMVYVSLLQCPQCGRWCSKLLWPQRIWTVADAVGSPMNETEAHSAGFRCWRCADVVYESAERTSRPAPGRRVNAKGRFIRRALGNVG